MLAALVLLRFLAMVEADEKYKPGPRFAEAFGAGLNPMHGLFLHDVLFSCVTVKSTPQGSALAMMPPLSSETSMAME